LGATANLDRGFLPQTILEKYYAKERQLFRPIVSSPEISADELQLANSGEEITAIVADRDSLKQADDR